MVINFDQAQSDQIIGFYCLFKQFVLKGIFNNNKLVINSFLMVSHYK